MSSHLTWWSVTVFVIVNIATFADWLVGNQDKNKVAPILNSVAIVLTHTVVVGVVVMSGMGCTMLADTANDVGVVLYIIGNFMLHYYPAIRSAWRPSAYFYRVAPKAAAIVVTYGIAFAPPHVYGCEWPPVGYTAMLLAGVSIMIVGFAAAHRRLVRPRI